MKTSVTKLPGVFAFFALTCAVSLYAQDAETPTGDEASSEAEAPETAESVSGATPDRPRAMSGMAILGNEEAPKALVIIPWKSSELGDEIGMPQQLDDKATPVDREVFLRELRFYEIRKGDDQE